MTGAEQAKPAQPSVADRLLAEAAAFAARATGGSAETACDADENGAAEGGGASNSGEDREAALRKQLIDSQQVEAAPRGGAAAPSSSPGESPAQPHRSPAREANSLEDIGSRTVDCFEKVKLGEGQYGAVYVPTR